MKNDILIRKSHCVVFQRISLMFATVVTFKLLLKYYKQNALICKTLCCHGFYLEKMCGIMLKVFYEENTSEYIDEKK